MKKQNRCNLNWPSEIFAYFDLSSSDAIFIIIWSNFRQHPVYYKRIDGIE